MATKTKKSITKKYYFARTAAMAAVLWNPVKKSPWAEFDRWGLFVTTDKKVAQAVLNAGYPQVTLKEIKDRNLPIPTGDSPTMNYQPGAPGRGYQPTGGVPATAMPMSNADLDDSQGFSDEDFPEGPDPTEQGEGRALR